MQHFGEVKRFAVHRRLQRNPQTRAYRFGHSFIIIMVDYTKLGIVSLSNIIVHFHMNNKFPKDWGLGTFSTSLELKIQDGTDVPELHKDLDLVG